MVSTGGENSTRRTIISNNVAAGSVWESRMKIDQVRGGVKVFNGGSENVEFDDKSEIRDTEQTIRSAAKRRTRDSIQIAGNRSDSQSQRKKMSGNRKIPVQLPRKKSTSDPRSDLELSKTRDSFKAVGLNRSGKDIGGSDQLETEKSRSDEEREVEEVKERIDEEIEVEKSISDSDHIQMNATQISHSKPKTSSQLAIAVARRSIRAEFSPVKKPPPQLSRPTHSTPMDLVMWKHVPRSSLAFGFGTFLIISSSYTKDLNISFISVTSYLGLIYLAIIFLYKSFRCRHIAEGNDMNYCHGLVVIGEEEAIRVLRLILTYVNEFFLDLKALFSGDPAVTMKLAAALFALARCGSYITIWKMVKLGFFAAFILPRLCSSYSAQVTGYGMFWILRVEDAWSSCSHKKVVGFAIFTIVWNFSSMVARIWAVFMLFVAVRYYQQSTIKVESWDEVGVEGGTCNVNRALRRPQVISKLSQRRRSTTSMPSTP